jgi:hypothetical protein
VPFDTATLTLLVMRGERLVQQGEQEGLLAWAVQRSSKRYALLIALAGFGRPITDSQCADLAGMVYGTFEHRTDWEALKHEGRSLHIRWIATSSRADNPNRGFAVIGPRGIECALWDKERITPLSAPRI